MAPVRLAGELSFAAAGVRPHDLVAARALRDVQCLVRRLYQRLARVAVPREDGDAEADRQIRYGFAIQHDRLALEGFADPLGNSERRTAVGTAQHEHELVTSITSDEVLRTHSRHQDLASHVT